MPDILSQDEIDASNVTAADMTKFGRVYMGYAGSGAHYADYADTASAT